MFGGILKYIFFSLILYSSYLLANPCEKSFASLIGRAVREILETQGITQPEMFFRDRAVQISRAQVDMAIKEHLHRINELNLLSEEVRNCRKSTTCLRSKGLALIDKVKLTVQSIKISFLSEKKAEKEIVERVETAAQEWIEANYEKLRELNFETEEIGEIKLLVSEELKSLLIAKKFSIRDFFKEIIGHFKRAFQALNFRELREDEIVRTDYRRNVTTVLSIQFGAHLMHALNAFLSGQTFGFFNKLWIYANTVFMMSIQAEVGARNQRKIKEPLPIRNFKDFLRELPNILIGDKGFWRDSQRKFIGFLTLLPLEYAVTVAAKAINVMAEKGPSALLHSNTQAEIALVNLASTAIFGTYLSLKWTLIDKWFYLNLLPSIRNSTMELAKEKLNTLKEKGLVPNEWKLEDFYRAAQKPRFWKFWSRHGVDLRSQVLEEVFMSKESYELLETYRTSTRAQRFEWAWRYGTCLIDSYIVFGLFGSWIPKLFGF